MNKSEYSNYPVKAKINETTICSFGPQIVEFRKNDIYPVVSFANKKILNAGEYVTMPKYALGIKITSDESNGYATINDNGEMLFDNILFASIVDYKGELMMLKPLVDYDVICKNNDEKDLKIKFELIKE